MSTGHTESASPRLWEIKHPYYCNESNYYARGDQQPVTEYKSWPEFAAAEGEADFDMNLVFRWDWREGPDWDLAEFNGDPNYRNGKLLVFWMGQRKGLYRWTEIEVCRADEPAIREWLKPRLKHLLSLWAPLTDEERV
jgi:hypothetical protein